MNRKCFRRLKARMVGFILILISILLLSAGPRVEAYENQEEGIFSNKVVIGASLPLSGTLASMGKSIVEGAEIYLAMVNEKGGINDRKIEVKWYDDEYKPDKCLANSKLLVEKDKVFAFMANMGTATQLAAYEYTSTKKIPMVGMLSIADTVTNPPREYLFALPAPQSAEAPAYVDYAITNLKANKFAILYQNDTWGQPAKDFTEKRLAKHGLKLVETQTFERLTTDLTSQVYKLKEANPDVVILYALGQQAAIFFKTAQKLGWSPVVFGAGGLNDPKTVELVGDIAEKKLYCSSYYWPMDSDVPAIQEYVKRHRTMYPKSEVSTMALMGYSSAAVFCEALKNAGPEPNREKLIAALEKMKNFDQKIGPPITFEPVSAGPYARRGQTGVVIVQLQGGKFKALGGFVDPIR
ncbi:MAG: ABC transporter substrate-binding protein [Thermodesulfobacteriota bacterium]